MKIKNNLFLVIILFAIIPMMLVNTYDKSKLKTAQVTSFQDSLKNVSKVSSENLNSYFEDIFSVSRGITALSYIKNIVDSTNADNSKALEQTNITLNNLMLSNPTIHSAFIINDRKLIVASTDADLVGRDANAYSYYKDNPTSLNVLSSIFEMEIEAKKIPAFLYTKPIYDTNDEMAGTLVLIFNTSFLQRTINSSKVFSTTHVFLMDSTGNVFQYPYSTTKKYDQIIEYSSIYDFFKNAINQNTDYRFENYKYDNTKKIVYQKLISSTNWSIVMITNENEISTVLTNTLFSIRYFVVFISLVIILLTAFYIKGITKPISEIVEVLHKKQRGDKYARFNVKTKNEFMFITSAFNSMVDDMSESEQRYRTVVEMSENIIFEYNIKKNIVRVSDNFNSKFSFRAKTERFDDSFLVNINIHKEDREKFELAKKNAFINSNYAQGEFRFKNIYGDYIWILIRATMLYDREDAKYKAVGVLVDIDRAKKSELRLLQRANYDALTQLFNRETFEKTLINEFELAQMRKKLDAVLFVDIDDFKHFNDEYGHACGDEVLKYVATSIKNLVDGIGFAGRYGGDEFVICLNAQNSTNEAAEFSKKLIQILHNGFTSDIVKKELSIKCSIGISYFEQNGINCDTVIEEADDAMYKVKKNGKSDYGFYSNNNH